MLPGDQMTIVYNARVVGTDIVWPATEYMLRRAVADADKIRAEVRSREGKIVIDYRHGLRVEYAKVAGLAQLERMISDWKRSRVKCATTVYGGHKVRAWRVPGTPEFARDVRLQREIEEFRETLEEGASNV